MIVEIVSGNWGTDVVEKQEDYEALGVPEYWMLDERGQIKATIVSEGRGKRRSPRRWTVEPIGKQNTWKVRQSPASPSQT